MSATSWLILCLLDLSISYRGVLESQWIDLFLLVILSIFASQKFWLRCWVHPIKHCYGFLGNRPFYHYVCPFFIPGGKALSSPSGGFASAVSIALWRGPAAPIVWGCFRRPAVTCRGTTRNCPEMSRVAVSILGLLRVHVLALNGSRLGAPSPGETLRSSSRLSILLVITGRSSSTLSGQLVSEFVVVTVSPGASAPPELLLGSAVRVREAGTPSMAAGPGRRPGVKPEGCGHSATLQPHRSRHVWAIKDVDSLPNRLWKPVMVKHHQRSSRYRRRNDSCFGIHLTVHLTFGREVIIF